LDNLKFSYIQPRKKQLISAEVGLVLSFFGVLFLFVIGVYIYLSFQINAFDKESIALQHQIEQNNFYADEVTKDIKILNLNLKLSKELDERNKFFKDSIKNILNLVPDKITLSKLELEENRLVVYGETPTKDLYNLLMLAPLRSIFDKSYTSFYLLENGWYRFVSYNSMDENLTIFRNRFKDENEEE
jgi:hypothetical protein